MPNSEIKRTRLGQGSTAPLRLQLLPSLLSSRNCERFGFLMTSLLVMCWFGVTEGQLSQIAAVGVNGTSDDVILIGACDDMQTNCTLRGINGECETDPVDMLVNCPFTCNSCLPTTPAECEKDKGDPDSCFLGAILGECEANPSYYLRFCAASCSEFLPACSLQTRDFGFSCAEESRSLRTPDFDCGPDVRVDTSRQARSRWLSPVTDVLKRGIGRSRVSASPSKRRRRLERRPKLKKAAQRKTSKRRKPLKELSKRRDATIQQTSSLLQKKLQKMIKVIAAMIETKRSKKPVVQRQKNMPHTEKPEQSESGPILSSSVKLTSEMHSSRSGHIFNKQAIDTDVEISSIITTSTMPTATVTSVVFISTKTSTVEGTVATISTRTVTVPLSTTVTLLSSITEVITYCTDIITKHPGQLLVAFTETHTSFSYKTISVPIKARSAWHGLGRYSSEKLLIARDHMTPTFTLSPSLKTKHSHNYWDNDHIMEMERAWIDQITTTNTINSSCVVPTETCFVNVHKNKICEVTIFKNGSCTLPCSDDCLNNNIRRHNCTGDSDFCDEVTIDIEPCERKSNCLNTTIMVDTCKSENTNCPALNLNLRDNTDNDLRCPHPLIDLEKCLALSTNICPGIKIDLRLGQSKKLEFKGKSCFNISVENCDDLISEKIDCLNVVEGDGDCLSLAPLIGNCQTVTVLGKKTLSLKPQPCLPEPTDPTTKPTDPTTNTTIKPTYPTTEPPETTTEPPKTTTNPPNTTTKPPKTTTKPPETTTKPPETTTEPPKTTTEPPETTTKPPETTTKPPETTTKPPETTTKPPETTTKPTTKPPETTTEPPKTTTKPPETTTEPPKTTTEPPETSTNPTIKTTYPTTEPLTDPPPDPPPPEEELLTPETVAALTIASTVISAIMAQVNAVFLQQILQQLIQNNNNQNNADQNNQNNQDDQDNNNNDQDNQDNQNNQDDQDNNNNDQDNQDNQDDQSNDQNNNNSDQNADSGNNQGGGQGSAGDSSSPDGNVPSTPADSSAIIPNCDAGGYMSLVEDLQDLIGQDTGLPLVPEAFDIVEAVNFCQHGSGGSEVPSMAEDILKPDGNIEPPPEWLGLSSPINIGARSKRRTEMNTSVRNQNHHKQTKIQSVFKQPVIEYGGWIPVVRMSNKNSRLKGEKQSQNRLLHRRKRKLQTSKSQNRYSDTILVIDNSLYTPSPVGISAETTESSSITPKLTTEESSSSLQSPIENILNVTTENIQNTPPTTTEGKASNASTFHRENILTGTTKPFQDALLVTTSGKYTAPDITTSTGISKSTLNKLHSVHNVTESNSTTDLEKDIAGTSDSVKSQEVIQAALGITPANEQKENNEMKKEESDKEIGEEGEEEEEEDTTDDENNGNEIEKRRIFFCGGTLITQRHILTAAHCVIPRKPNLIRLGERDFSSDEESKTVDYGVEIIAVYPEYKFPIKYNDIAIITLKENIPLNSGLVPSCIPPSKLDLQEGQDATVSGWGTRANEKASDILIDVEVQVRSQQRCNESYNTLGEVFTIHYPDGIIDSMVCAAGEGGADVCRGDSGGPLFLKELLQIAGVVSAGFGCGDENFPGLYTRVDSFLTWIDLAIYGRCASPIR